MEKEWQQMEADDDENPVYTWRAMETKIKHNIWSDWKIHSIHRRQCR